MDSRVYLMNWPFEEGGALLPLRPVWAWVDERCDLDGIYTDGLFSLQNLKRRISEGARWVGRMSADAQIASRLETQLVALVVQQSKSRRTRSW